MSDLSDGLGTNLGYFEHLDGVTIVLVKWPIWQTNETSNDCLNCSNCPPDLASSGVACCLVIYAPCLRLGGGVLSKCCGRLAGIKCPNTSSTDLLKRLHLEVDVVLLYQVCVKPTLGNETSIINIRSSIKT